MAFWLGLLLVYIVISVIISVQYSYSTDQPSGNMTHQLGNRLLSCLAMPALMASFHCRGKRPSATAAATSDAGDEPARTNPPPPLTRAAVFTNGFAIAALSSVLALAMHSMMNSLLMGTRVAAHSIGTDDFVDTDNLAGGMVLLYGIVAHRVSLPGMVLVALVVIPVNIFNHVVTYGLLGVADTGNTLTVVLFVVYAGLAVVAALERRKPSAAPAPAAAAVSADPELQQASVASEAAETSDDDALMSIVATALVYCCYPSLAAYWAGDPNAAGSASSSSGSGGGGVSGAAKAQRAVVNTNLALMSSVLTGVLLHLHDHAKDATASNSQSLGGWLRTVALSGGIAVGAVCNANLSPTGSLLIGSGAAVASWLSVTYLDPTVDRICGTAHTASCSSAARLANSMFGIPALVGGIVSIVAAATYQGASTSDLKGLWEADPSNVLAAQIGGVVLAPVLGILSGGLVGAFLPLKEVV